MKTASRVGTASIVALALMSVGLPAHATDSNEATARLVADVAPHQGRVVAVDEAGGDIGASASGLNVEVPVDPAAAPLELSSSDGEASLAIKLPGSAFLGDANVASDGTVVYQSKTGDADVAVQVLSDGSARVQTITSDADGPHQFSYGIQGATPVTGPDGQVALVHKNDDGTLAVASLEDAWARDANGAAVATHYEVQGDDVVQVVTPGADTVYPVVADPKFKWISLAYSAKFNRAETRSLATAGGATAMCRLMAKMPGGTVLEPVCFVYGAYIFTQAVIANGAKKCIYMTIAPPGLVYRYKDSDCR